MSTNPFQGLPMPKYDGEEPSEIEIQRIRKHLEEGRFDELSKELQRWVCHRLMPSLTRFGVYPPPAEANAGFCTTMQRPKSGEDSVMVTKRDVEAWNLWREQIKAASASAEGDSNVQ